MTEKYLIITLSDEQQGFRTGSSCINAIYVMQQLAEKSIEFNKPGYKCLVNLEKAFERILLKDGLEILRKRKIPEEFIDLIKDQQKMERIIMNL